MYRILVILNDAPYGSERSYNGLRLADSPARKEAVEVRVFLMGDSVLCAKSGQLTPQGFYNIERMLKPVLRHGQVAACGTCMEARGMTDDELTGGAHHGTLAELTEWTMWADKVLVF